MMSVKKLVEPYIIKTKIKIMSMFKSTSVVKKTIIKQGV